jgi:hypothetical protein
LNSTDEMLYRASHNLGSARVVQVLWRFSSEVSTVALRREWERLNHGRLSRQAVGAWVPGARRRWVGAHNTEPLREYTQTLTEHNLMDWIDTQVQAPLPAGSGALWRLAATPYRGGSVVSLTVPHFRGDGMGVFAAVGSQQPSQGHSPSAAGLAARLAGSDLADAVGQTALAIAGSTRWAIRLVADRHERGRISAALRTGHGPSPGSSPPRFFSSAVFELDATLWNERAMAYGGTANALFVEIAANLIRTRIAPGDRGAFQVGIPMSLRRSDVDARANALVVVALAVPAGAPQHEDLRRTRRSTKAALRGADERSTTLVPEPVWHMLPRRYADRLKAPGAQQTDVVASNFGDVPAGVVRFAGQRADSVALRTMNVPGLVPQLARLRASLCLLQVNDRVTVTATGLPDVFGDADSLRRLVADEFLAWGLKPERWS